MKFLSKHNNKFSKSLIWPAALIFVGVILCAMVLFLGLAVGLVGAAFVVLSAVGYRIHVDRLSQKTRQISEASRIHLATVEALATAIDARDQIGIGHVRRTQIYAVGLGNAMGLSETDIEAIRTGALLHDIGKLAIPDHILSKPDGFTPAELEKTKIHSTVGAAILEKVGFETPVIPTIRYHHERWDGKGYPEGLQGEAIPLTARVLSIADAYDTLRGARPYRPALEREKARRIIQGEAGTRFDPNLVDAFMRILPVLEDEVDAHGLSYFDSSSRGKLMGDHKYVEQIKLANREVVSLFELAREFSSSLNLEDALRMFAKKLGEMVAFDSCAVYLLDPTKRHAIAAHATGANAELIISRTIRIGQGVTGHALKTGETVLNVDHDLDFAYSQSELTGEYSALASVPLVADKELIGAVTIYSRDLSEYGEEDIRLLQTITHTASEAIGKARKHDETRIHALTDPMTGLPNARSLQIQFEKEVARANRGSSNFQMLMLDLDGFKAVNDTFGHKVGDAMLKAIGQAIRDQLRDYDFLARYGGDEFVALVPDATPDDLQDLCSRIEKAVTDYRLPIEGSDKFASVGVSLGGSGYPKNGETFDQMIVAADKVMYVRKSNRKKFLMTHNALARPGNERKTQRDERPFVYSNDNLIVELDETHVIASSAVN